MVTQPVAIIATWACTWTLNLTNPSKVSHFMSLAHSQTYHVCCSSYARLVLANMAAAQRRYRCREKTCNKHREGFEISREFLSSNWLLLEPTASLSSGLQRFVRKGSLAYKILFSGFFRKRKVTKHCITRWTSFDVTRRHHLTELCYRLIKFTPWSLS